MEPAPALFGTVAEVDGCLVGLAHFLFHPSTWSTGSYCYLEDLFVDPAARGAGAGRALIEGVACAAADGGAEKLYWQTHVDNAVARSLYDRVATHDGFLVYERSPLDPGSASS